MKILQTTANPVTFTKMRFLLGAASAFVISYILEINFIIPAFLLSLYLYLKYAYRNSERKNYRLLHLNLLFVIFLVISYTIAMRGWSLLWTPFSLAPMLSVILFNDLGISLLITLASAVTIAAVGGNNFPLGVLALISGILSGLLVSNARRRMAIIRAGITVGLAQIASLLLIERFIIQDAANYKILMLNGVFSSILVIGVLPVFEYLFETVTDISLLEWADFSQPLLQRMIMEAPGTYHHSLVVGNLSEAACGAVGAHALLARVGAYYHDIGKLYKPEYFSENRSSQENKHDALPPSMSKMVIMNHVKEGVELARKQKLNPRLIDFIQQHHGMSLVYYFYRRALENTVQQEEVSEEGFRYPGPKPSTRETAIVLLADSVEAAVRTLKDPSAARIEELVRKIINNKFIDGQLDACDLTLRDLEKISSVFIRILSGIYHSRITYPENTKS